MSKNSTQVLVKKPKIGDVEVKGKKKGKNKKTNQGNSRNTKSTTKNATREKKGRK